MFDHTSSSADGCDSEPVGFCKSLDFTNGKRVGSRKEEFDIIETNFFRKGERLGKRLAENEGACSGFGDLGESDGGAHKFQNSNLKFQERLRLRVRFTAEAQRSERGAENFEINISKLKI